MSLIRLLSENFDPGYVKPRVLVRAARELLPVDKAVSLPQYRLENRPERRRDQRRIAQRRQQQRDVLLDLRSPRCRRKCAGRRRADQLPWQTPTPERGIDTFA